MCGTQTTAQAKHTHIQLKQINQMWWVYLRKSRDKMTLSSVAVSMAAERVSSSLDSSARQAMKSHDEAA